jgi:hypothetical protein
MNCEQCREEFLSRGPSEATDAHAAECGACRDSLPGEAALMALLDRAGATWRSSPLGESVVKSLDARSHSLGAGRARTASGVRRAVRFGVAATLALAAGSALFLASRPTPANAMVLMAREVRERGTVRFAVEVPHGPMESGVLSVAGPRMRLDRPNGEAVVADLDARRTALIRPASRTVITGENAGGTLDLYAFLLALADAPRIEEIGVGEIGGQPAEIVRVHVEEPMMGLSSGTSTVWIDLATRLPRRVEIPTRIRDEAGNEVGATIVLRDFEFDVVFPEGTFETEPEGFAAAAPEATTPGVGIQMGTKIRHLAMAFHTHMQTNGGTVPESLEALAPYLEEGGLRSARRPEEPIGYVYVKPTLPLNYDAVLAYERFAEGSESLWVVLIDGSAHVKTHTELNSMLEGTR